MQGIESDTKWESDTNDIAGIEFSLDVNFFFPFSFNLCMFFFSFLFSLSLPSEAQIKSLSLLPRHKCPSSWSMTLEFSRTLFYFFLFFSFSVDPFFCSETFSQVSFSASTLGLLIIGQFL